MLLTFERIKKYNYCAMAQKNLFLLKSRVK